MQITHAYLKEHGLLPRKAAAQYLLTDSAVVDATVRALDIRPGDSILEIGAGLGALTERIVREIDTIPEPRPSLVSVEIDQRYADVLRSRFGGRPWFRVLQQDILGLDFRGAFAGPGKVAGNIPYYISGPILRLLFDHHDVITDIVIMLQKEVGMRVAAMPSGEQFGLLSIMRLLHYDAEVVRQVDRRLFLPVPRVDSVVIKLHVHSPLISGEDEHTLIGILKYAFSGRRKMLRNTLKPLGGMPEVAAWCRQADIDLQDRAENIDLDRWIRFLHAYNRGSGTHPEHSGKNC
jgi:16S rRNA (adenine1518-N6/adenine1519-N6)-dimethyltransferase